MPEDRLANYRDTCAKLRLAITDLDARVRVSEQNSKLKATYTEKVDILQQNILLCGAVLDTLKPMLRDMQEYVAQRKKASMQNINNALRMAGEIISDSSEGIHFEVEGNDAWLSTPEGLEVDMVEGGGYRQISSTFIRNVVLDANPDNLSTLLLDEVFSQVSPENSSTLSLYLNVVCQDRQIISIEQKPQVYSNIDCTAFVFTKGDTWTEVKKKVIEHGGGVSIHDSETA